MHALKKLMQCVNTLKS